MNDSSRTLELQDNWKEYFPLPQIRPKQEKALDFIYRMLADGIRDIVIAAPTGSGKSAIGATVAFWAASSPFPILGRGGAYYLCTQKLLQDQLEHDIHRYPIMLQSACSLKTASEYDCPFYKDCGTGRKHQPPCSRAISKTCAYKLQVNKFLNSDLAITNYPYFFTERIYSGQFPVRRILVADECFPGSTLVETTNGPIPISDLRPGDRVLSMNTKSGHWSYEEVLRQWSTGEQSLVRVSTEKGDICCTASHPLLTTAGWIDAGNLIPGATLVGKRFGRHTRRLSQRQTQVVIGSYLGDGSLAAVPGGFRLRWTHGIAQKGYCEWKAAIFKGKTWPVAKNGYAGTPAIRAQTPAFSLDYPAPAETCKREVPAWMLDQIGPEALAIWFMDDGSTKFNEHGLTRITLHTESFSQSCCEAVCQALRRRFKLNGAVKPAKDKYWIITFNKAESIKFAALVVPYLHPELAYKLRTKCKFAPTWSSSFLPQLFRVKAVKTMRSKRECFDLEVRNTHNFVARMLHSRSKTSFGKSGIVAHNCHTLESQLLKFAELVIGQHEIERFMPSVKLVPLMKTLEDFTDWLNDVYLIGLSTYLESFDPATLTPKRAREYDELIAHIGKVRRALYDFETDPSNWIYWQETEQRNGSGPTRVAIAKPLRAATYFKELIEDASTVRIYMSAYPGDKAIFCRMIGLDPDKTAMLSLGSVFKKENRPIHLAMVGSMSKRNQEETLPGFLRFLRTIMDAHQEEKGIIHGNSYALCATIFKAFQGTDQGLRLLFPANADEREAVYKRHLESVQPTIVLSPSFTEGFDFADDAARWQVIAKCPYPFLGDKQVLAKKEADPEWYAQKTVEKIIQASGRICRSETDRGISYIIDSDFELLYDKYGYMFPQWWKEALVFH